MPMPILMRDKWVHIRFSRGSEYCNCASSTARRDSLVWARRRKFEDQFRAIEHLDAGGLFKISSLGRAEIVVEQITSASSPWASSFSSPTLPLPR